MRTHIVIALNMMCISGLLYLFYYLYRAYRVDLLRLSLIHTRDRLFEAAARGVIDFNSPAYIMTRQTLNGMIRFAHELSLMRTAFLVLTERWWYPKDYRDGFLAAYSKAIEDLSPRSRTAIAVTMDTAHYRVVSHLLHTSLATVVPAMIVKFVVHLKPRVRGWIAKKVEPRTRSLDREAYEVGYCS